MSKSLKVTGEFQPDNRELAPVILELGVSYVPTSEGINIVDITVAGTSINALTLLKRVCQERESEPASQKR